MKAKQNISKEHGRADGNRAVGGSALRFWVKADGIRLVHLQGVGQSDVALCGLTLTGDKALGIEAGQQCRAKVDCPQCIAIVRYCKSISLASL